MKFPRAMEVDEKIKNTPTELGKLYNRLVHTAFEDRRNIAILAWIDYARRPLCVEEIETAAAITMDSDVTSWVKCCSEKALLDRDTIRENLGR